MTITQVLIKPSNKIFMKNAPEPISLTQRLIQFNTVNPPGRERACAAWIGKYLEDARFQVSFYEFDNSRTSLVAIREGAGEKAPLCFSGHLDTVPTGRAPWGMDPFNGEIKGDKIYGRGASDMKGGIAAMVSMALRLSKFTNLKAGVRLIFTAGEETGCEGARYLAGTAGLLSGMGALVIGEPTSNRPLVGHKGAVRFELTARGKTAHAAMPGKGENAIYKAARALTRLEAFDFGVAENPVLGKPTLNVGIISGGININSVPDLATIGVDIRPTPGLHADEIKNRLGACLGPDITIRCLEAFPGVLSDPDDPWIREVFEMAAPHLKTPPTPEGAPYFTDASFLVEPMGHPPTVLLGPGESEQAHSTDEFCYLARIEEATEIYFEMAQRWCLAG